MSVQTSRVVPSPSSSSSSSLKEDPPKPNEGDHNESSGKNMANAIGNVPAVSTSASTSTRLSAVGDCTLHDELQLAAMSAAQRVSSFNSTKRKVEVFNTKAVEALRHEEKHRKEEAERVAMIEKKKTEQRDNYQTWKEKALKRRRML